MEDLLKNIFPEFHVEKPEDIEEEQFHSDFWFEQSSMHLKHLAKSVNNAVEEIKWYIKTFPQNTIIYNIYSALSIDITECCVILNHFRKALHCSLTYDYYDEFCDIIEPLDNALSEFCSLEINRKSLLDALPEYDNVWNTMRDKGSPEHRAFAEKNIEDSKMHHQHIGQLQSYVKVSIASLLRLIDDVRKYRFNRSDSEITIIYLSYLKRYKQNEFPEKWVKFKRKTLDHELRYKGEIKSIHWVDIKNLCWNKFICSNLGEIYSDYYMDGDDELAKRISQKNAKKEELDEYFFNLCLQNALDEEIMQLREEENRADPDFRNWVDVSKLQDYASTWIIANIKDKYQWTVVFSVFHELKLLRNDCDPEKLCNRLNRLFPKASKPCVWESIRKYIGKKWDTKKMYLQPISTWQKDDMLQPLAMSFYAKLRNKDKYSVPEND